MDDEPTTFLPPRYFAVSGYVCAPFFTAMAIAGVWLPLANPDGSFREPLKFAVFDGTFFLVMAAVSGYVLLYGRRSRLVVINGRARLVTAFTDRTIELAEVTSARWRRFPATGSLVLITPIHRRTIYFDNYDRPYDVVAFFRRALPESLQRDYSGFEASTDRRRKSPPVYGSGELLWAAAACLAAAGLACLAWNIQWVRLSALSSLPLICPAVAVLATIDCVRRPGRFARAAVAAGWTAVAATAALVWSAVGPG